MHTQGPDLTMEGTPQPKSMPVKLSDTCLCSPLQSDGSVKNLKRTIATKPNQSSDKAAKVNKEVNWNETILWINLEFMTL